MTRRGAFERRGPLVIVGYDELSEVTPAMMRDLLLTVAATLPYDVGRVWGWWEIEPDPRVDRLREAFSDG